MATSTLRSDKTTYEPLFNYDAIILTFTASADIVAGAPVVASGKTCAMAYQTHVTGIALDSAAVGNSLRVLIKGVIESPLATFLGAGTELFLTGVDYSANPNVTAVFTDTASGTPARVGRNLHIRLANGNKFDVLVFNQTLNSSTDELLTPPV